VVRAANAPITPPSEIPVAPLPPQGQQAPPALFTPTYTMGFYFCEKCGVRVTDADVKAGLARDKQLNGVVCAKCAEGTLTVTYDAISQQELQKEVPNRQVIDRRSTSVRLPASKATAGTTSRRLHFSASTSRSPALLIIVICASAALLAVVAFLILRTREDSVASRKDNPPVQKPPVVDLPSVVTPPPELPAITPGNLPPPPPVTPEPGDNPTPYTVPDQPPPPPGEALPEKPLSPAEAAMAQAGPGHREQLAFWLRHDPAKEHEAFDAVRSRSEPLSGGAEWIAEPKGDVLAFDKANGCVELNPAPLNGQANWTWAAWVWPENNGALYSEGNPQGTFQLSIAESGAVLIRAWHHDHNGNWLDSPGTPGTVPLKQWSHLAVTLTDGRANDGTYRVYVNGKEVSTAAGQAAFHRDTKFAALGDYIGARREGRQEHAFFQGRVRDLRIYQRALNADEVRIIAEWDTAVPLVVTTQTTSPIVREKEDDTETALPQTPRTVDLMPLVNLATDAVSGPWLSTEGGLRCYPASAARIALPYLPPQEYDLRLVFTEHSGQDAIGPILSHAGRSFIVVAGGWANTVAGFEAVDGKAANANPTTNRRASVLEMGKRHTLVARVRKTGTEVLLDDQVITSYKGNYGNLSPAGWSSLGPGREQQLGVGVWRSCVTFHAIEAVEIKGRGRIVRQTMLRTRSGPAEGKALAPAYLLRLIEALDTESPERARNLIGFARSEPSLAGVNASLDRDLELTGIVEQITKVADETIPLLKDGRAVSLRLCDNRTVALGPGAPNRFLEMKDGKAQIEVATANGKIVESVDALRLCLQSRGELVLLTRPDDALGRFGRLAGRIIGLLKGPGQPVEELEKELGELAGKPALAACVERLRAWLAQVQRERAARVAFEQFRKPLNTVQQDQLQNALKTWRNDFADTLFVQNAAEDLAAFEQYWLQGLRVLYFAGDQKNLFKKMVQARYEDGLERNWGKGPLLPGLQADLVGIRMEGLLRIDKSGIYEFQLVADDELAAQIGSVSVVTRGVGQPAAVKTSLGVGDQTLKIAFKEFTGDAYFRLSWKPPGQGKFTPIPPEVLYTRADATLQSP
jgi:hypothetical protein